MKRALLLVPGLLFVAPTPSLPAERPNVVLITLDTTRADRMGFLGSRRGLTPELDLLAKESVVFEKIYAKVIDTVLAGSGLKRKIFFWATPMTSTFFRRVRG